MARIEKALISVSDKTGVVEFAKGLAALGVEILSTGGTAKSLREAGLTVVDVADYTGSPEVMDGRVKTLHPRVHGGILMRDLDTDKAELASLGGAPIGIVCVNLYPFAATVAKGAPHDEIIENIDIGGPSMVRSAAKNHARVAIVTDPSDYAAVLEQVKASGDTTKELRAKLAAKAFSHTAAYDGAIAGYLTSLKEDGTRADLPGFLALTFEKAYDVRYGENPHQKGAFYVEKNARDGLIARAESLGAGGKELSYNNLVDVEAALDCVREFERPAAVVVKHTNPCGVAEGEVLEQAYRTAREADSVSAFGGIVAFNRAVDLLTAKALAETFLECIVAPSFDPDALELLTQKKALRLLATGKMLGPDFAEWQYKRVGGGLLVQERDATRESEVRAGRVVSKRAPTEDELAALEFAWRVGKHVKSNAIILAKPGRTVGVGAGQMSRVVSVQIAAQKAGAEAKGSVLASDAFFPFRDGVDSAVAAGASAIVQPGGSVRDEEVIAAADEAGIAMIFTGFRHFRH